MKLEGVELEEQSRAATEAARTAGTPKKQVVPEDLLEEAFELNMQLEEMRAAKKMGEDDPQLRQDLLAAKATFDAKLADADNQLQGLWSKWDGAVDRGDESAKAAARMRNGRAAEPAKLSAESCARCQ